MAPTQTLPRQGRLRRVVSAADFSGAKWPRKMLEAVGFEEVEPAEDGVFGYCLFGIEYMWLVICY